MMATQLDRIERMLRALCDHLGVHEATASRTQIATDVDAESGQRYVGVVSRFEHGWGFIESAELGRNFFVHYSDVEGTGLRLLEAGVEVSFEIGPGKDGRPKAVRVRRQSTGQTRSGRPPAPVVSGQETAGEETGPADVEDAGDEEGDMPQPDSSEALSRRSSPRGTGAGRTRRGALRGGRPATSW